MKRKNELSGKSGMRPAISRSWIIRFSITVAILMLFPGTTLFAKAKADNGTEQNIAVAQTGQAKYVFLFIGDGMAMSQISSTEVYTTARSSSDISITRLGFTRFPVSGLTTTYDAGTFITDSASAITAIATGNKTLSGVLNMDPGKTKSFKTIAEYAHEAGMKIGVVSSVTLDHATPAGFFAKVPSRSNYYDIAVQMVKSGFEYFAGGGLLQPTGKNKDQRDVIQMAKDAGYTFVNSKAEFDALRPGSGKIIAINATLQDSGSMPYELDRKADDLCLADYTNKGIELLQDNPEGFFLTVEGGKIDWACHANDAGAAINDVIAFDNAIKAAVDFAQTHPRDTLIIVTGDHETGGMTIGFAGTQYDTFFDKVALQKKSFIAFNADVLTPYKKNTPKDKAKLEDLILEIKNTFGLDYNTLSDFQKEQLQFAFQRSMGDEIERPVAEDQFLLYGGYEPLTVKITQTMNQTAGIGWTSYAHTGVPVSTFAMGVHQELFSGYYDNTDIFKKIVSAMNIKL
ncbi:MAG: alkaline phosphatase [Spirochaetaceae bacterium]|jgi:alkaline phosphatase|nr:alkaline phosphatase [Spirochaetaceae bacterium]